VSGPTDLVARVVAGDNKFLMELAADGVLPLSPEYLIPLQVHLAHADDAEIAKRASERLGSYEVEFLVDFLETGATVDVVTYLACNSPQPTVVESALRRRDLPAGTLVEVAETADESIQEIVLLRQDLIVEHPRRARAQSPDHDLHASPDRRDPP
jgi:hypothetical protein